MRIDYQVDPRELPELIKRFLLFVPLDEYKNRVFALDRKIHDNPFAARYIHDIHQIEYALVEVMEHAHSQNRLLPVNTSENIYKLYALVTAIVRIHEKLNGAAKKRLIGMIKGSLKSDDGFTSLQHEINTFVGLQAKNIDIECVDLNNSDNFDFYAAGEYAEFEIECKCVGGDLGRKITRKDALALYSRFAPTILRVIREGNAQHGGIITIRFKDRSTSDVSTLQNIAHSLEKLLDSAEFTISGQEWEIEFVNPEVDSSFFTKQQEGVVDPKLLQQFCLEHIGKPDPHAFLVGNANEGFMVLCVESSKPDKMLDKLLRVCKDAARQLAGKHAGIIEVQLFDMTSDEIAELIDNRNKDGNTNQLMSIAARFFESDRRSHVYGLSFRSHGIIYKGAMENDEVETPGTQEHGQLYFFRNPYHVSCNDQAFAIYSQ